MKKIKVAIVGRPNVGKSALFNRICKKRIAIVDEMEGVTRDRLYADADYFGRPFEIIDTGGIDNQSELPFNEEVKRQAEIAIEEADSLIMVVDAKVGLTKLDQEVARILKRTDKPLCLAVNKVDDFSKESMTAPFYNLGIGNLVPISANHGLNVAELLGLALEHCRETEEVIAENTIKVAVIGRPNVGKSTLINYLLDEDRCVVSPIAGTTRDAIDVTVVSKEGESFTFIDTAGIRRKKSEHDVVDKFAAIRTERAIQRADVCVLILDSLTGMNAQDKHIANQIEKEGKGCILLFNKWDLVKGFRMEHCLQGIKMEASFLNYCPTLFISALAGRNIEKIFPLIKEVHTQLHQRISTGQLNRFIEKSMQKYHPPMHQGKRLRIYYMAQINTAPPQFVFFVNFPTLMYESYKKYLINQFRETYGFTGAPLLFYLKKRNQEKKGRKTAPEVQDLFDEALLEEPDFSEADFEPVN